MESEGKTVLLDKQICISNDGTDVDVQVQKIVRGFGQGFPYRVYEGARVEMYDAGLAMKHKILHESPGTCVKEMDKLIAECVRDVLLKHAFGFLK